MGEFVGSFSSGGGACLNHYRRRIHVGDDRDRHVVEPDVLALTSVKVFLGWAQKPPRRYIPHNPCEGMVPTKPTRRKRKLSDVELARIFKTATDGNDAFSCIVLLLTLLGQRRTETASMCRNWVDAKERTITIPGEITKNGIDHTLPLGTLAFDLLAALPNLGDGYFPASRDHVRGKPVPHWSDWAKAKKAFDRKCGVKDWTLHDLRRKFATGLAILKVSPYVVERLLNHRLGSIANRTGDAISEVAEVYNLHTYLPEMREAIEKWEHFLHSVSNNSERSAA